MIITIRARAFTLLEVAVVAAVASIIFLILIRWMSTLGQVSGAIADKAIPARNASYVSATLSADLSSATVCDPANGTALRSVQPRSLELYTKGRRSDGTLGVILVRYEAADGQLTRTSWDVVSSVSDRCLPVPGTSTSAQVLAPWVYTPTKDIGPFFIAVRDGADAGTCQTSSTQAVTGGGCAATAIRFRATFVSTGTSTTDSADWPTSAAPVRVDRTFSLVVADSGSIS